MSVNEEQVIKAQTEALKKKDFSQSMWHKQDASDCLKQLGSSVEKGLSSQQVEKATATYGKNELEKEEETSLWERIVEQFEDLLVRILLLAAVISFIIAITGKYPSRSAPFK